MRRTNRVSFISSTRENFGQGLAFALQSVKIDVRDRWPYEITPNNYCEVDTLFSGRFGRVISARGRSLSSGLCHSEPRTCVIKTTDFASRLEQYEKSGGYNRLNRLQRRIILEAYILNRIRHSNIMHAHATVFDSRTLCLQYVLPRWYPLQFFIEKYRQDKDGEPMHIQMIMIIVRQVCRGLEYLHSSNIVHSDVQPNNIYVTRGGTLKLGHFSQSRVLTDVSRRRCLTPTGTEEFMCYEKQYNLRVAHSLDECIPYDTAADMWSVGVLIIHLVSYFPNEKWHRLPRNFALQMGELKMPFKWMVNELMQLRVRLARTGDEGLKKFLGEKLLNIYPNLRATATEILHSDMIKRWCHEELDKVSECFSIKYSGQFRIMFYCQDKEFIVRSLIHRYDWPNRFGLETDGPNYDACETKDVPVEFYWDHTWKKLEKRNFGFIFEIFDGQAKRSGFEIEKRFTYADNSLMNALMSAVDNEEIDMLDILPIDQTVRKLSFALMTSGNYETLRAGNASVYDYSKDLKIKLPPTLICSDRSAQIKVFFVMEIQSS
uniref:Protein kinase domain-containing protein n=1 Tax=Syphacia muris TaxID=451379 RepID=A0A0N5A8V7_9BILA